MQLLKNLLNMGGDLELLDEIVSVRCNKDATPQEENAFTNINGFQK